MPEPPQGTPVRRLCGRPVGGVFDQEPLGLEDIGQVAQLQGGPALAVEADQFPLGVVAFLGKPDDLF